jgi:type IV pilus assembly protein PilV
MKPLRHRHIRGFSLLEVLIAAVVLSFGLLGLVAMQVTAKFSSYEARQRTIANWLANDLVERARINKDSWAGQGTTVVSGNAILDMPSCANNNGTMSDCSRTERQALDLFYWQQSLLGTAVSGAASPLQSPVGCVIRGANNSLTIGIFWQGGVFVRWCRCSCRGAQQLWAGQCADRQRRQFVLTTTL